MNFSRTHFHPAHGDCAELPRELLYARTNLHLRSVPYYGQRPHKQGQSPHPLLCFSWNLRNAFRRAFPGLQEVRKKKGKSRIECLLDLFNFDVNQLLIYETRNRKHKNDCVVDTLRIMKMKVEEVKTMASTSKCLEKAETMLKRRDRLKCVSRSFRRQLIEHIANYDTTAHLSPTMCEIMKQLDGIDADINVLCKGDKYKDEGSCTNLVEGKVEEESSANLLKAAVCCEKPCEKFPGICNEVMRPYDPSTDEDAKSIHLRYIPELDSFKADMARNPCALRLPLMCPPMKRIMNKMKSSYLMDDVPCTIDRSLPNKGSRRNLTVGFVRFERCLDLSKTHDFDGGAPFEGVGKVVETASRSDKLNNTVVSSLWSVASQQLWRIYPRTS